VKLKYPPIQGLRHKHDPLRYPAPPLRFTFSSNQTELHELHPEPKHIFQLWQIFVEKIDPLTKIVHVPTLQQRVLDASWNCAKASKSLTTIMFAIYTLAITPMSSDDCQTIFGEAKDTLLTRYRAATVQSLIVSDFLTTRDLEILQALALFLFAGIESDLISTLTGTAIRLGLKMGLHQKNVDPQTSLFEKEMRIRLWWQLRCLDSRSRALSTPRLKPPPASEFGDIRLPLNINDADLHPDMVEPPVEHKGPTEMMCVMVKFELLNWLQSSPKAAKVFDNIVQSPWKNNMPAELEDETIDELDTIYQRKYFCNWDKNIPLHSLTHAVATFSISRMRFKAHHPRGRATANVSEVYISQQESDVLFDTALTALEMVDVSLHGKLSSHLFVHMTFTYQLDAYTYVISDLRRRLSGDRVAVAWRLIEDLYNEHTELIDDIQNTFFVALGDLTLEAWNARINHLGHAHDTPKPRVTPQFVRLLRDKRENVNEEVSQISAVPDPYDYDGPMLADDNELSWEYWNDLLQI
jgi:hypothetical protein